MTTAVLVFAYSPLEEMLHKQIPKGDPFFNELTAHTLKTVEKSGLSYFHFTEHEQRGSNFGERFTNAIQAIFDHGFDKVITMGNDTPELKASQIINAAVHLDQQEFVLGQSTDGGFYLMGIHKTQFDADKFLEIPWQTNRTAAAVLHLIKENNTPIVTLESLSDLDCISDVLYFLNSNSKISTELRALLHSIIGIKSLPIKYKENNFSLTYGKSYYNKGSPLVTV